MEDEIRDLCMAVVSAAGPTEFKIALTTLKTTLREHSLQLENLRVKAILDIIKKQKSET